MTPQQRRQLFDRILALSTLVDQHARLDARRGGVQGNIQSVDVVVTDNVGGQTTIDVRDAFPGVEARRIAGRIGTGLEATQRAVEQQIEDGLDSLIQAIQAARA